MNHIKFKQNVTDILMNQIDKIESRLCPDQYVGNILSFTDNQNDFCRRLERTKNVNCIILILESPHINEYHTDPAPAKGKTGKNIRKYLQEILQTKNINNNYEILLMNAIQYQCSLGKPTKFYRDDIFIKIWKDQGKNNFQNRLRNIVKENDIVINCCTKGNKKPELRILVQQAIQDSVQSEIKTFKINHPSSWWKKNYRKLEGDD